DSADDGPHTGAAADLLCRALALTLALCDGVLGDDLVDAVTERDRVQLQGDLVAALQGPGLLDADHPDHDRRATGDNHATVDHDRIVDAAFEGGSRLGRVDVDALAEAHVQQRADGNHR